MAKRMQEKLHNLYFFEFSSHPKFENFRLSYETTQMALVATYR